MMAGNRFYLFGSVRVEPVEPGYDTPVLTRTLQGLLAYLLLNRRRTHRSDVLAGVFWGNESEERARSCLSTALWRLRRALGGPYGEPSGVISNTGGEIGVRCDGDFWLDVQVFEDKTAIALSKDVSQLQASAARELDEAMGLYTGDALDGFYEDWALREKERLRLLYLNSLWYLMRFHALHNSLEEGVSYGQRILYHDPLREEIHRELIRLYLRMGQRPLALRQYAVCCDVLKAELGISPMPETRALHQQMLAGNEPDALPAAESSRSLQKALDEARLARRGLQTALDLLDRSLDLLQENSLQDRPPHP